MAKTKAVAETPIINIAPIQRSQTRVFIVGETGLYCHRMAAKAKSQLLMGAKKKTAAEKLQLKHDPVSEFVESMHVKEGMFPDTDVVFPASAFKAAMATAALVVPGIRKTDVQRLVYVPDEFVPIYGVPKLRMDVVRSADINKTPDIRTRAFFEEWATVMDVEFTNPPLTETAILVLLSNAGAVAGVGDFRQEKGKGSFGTFTTALNQEIPPKLANCLEEQREAIDNPIPYDDDTKYLLDLIQEEEAKRAKAPE